jgi:hypothetical protein
MDQIIYRIEHKKRKNKKKFFEGPYMAPQRLWTNRIHSWPTHPVPMEDNLLKEYQIKDWFGTHLCGFSSMRKLNRWFTNKELTTLKKMGFIMVSYRSEKVLTGRHQDLFVPKGRRKILSK